MGERSLWNRINDGLTRTRLVVTNLFFIGMMLLLAVLIFGGGERISVPDGGALVINPQGNLVEQRSLSDPLQEWLTPGAALAETEIDVLLKALKTAADDERIRLAVVNLDGLQNASTAHAEAAAAALKTFRAAGKEVIAYGNYYDQSHYLIASAADAVYMHPFGQIILPGFEINRLYFTELLDKLKVNINIFRVGRYKEFVEPYERIDMSDDARQANRELVDGLWTRYSDEVIANRDLDPERFERYAQHFDEVLNETGGDLARLAVEYGLVDELLTPDQARVRIADKVGYDNEGDFRGVAMADYLEATANRTGGDADRRVAIITAEGAIVDGDARGGVIAADRIIGLIRRAREDETVAALVLRVNSPGGSAFASELIRQELELTQLSGRPVVVSMGPVAASGGYWIASTADAIVAEPTTITGSIGVFGIVPTFDEGLAAIGVRSDGVRTSPLSNISPLLPINEPTARILQASVEHTYERFINLVARGRDLSPEQVDNIAQGRVWIGSRALDLGLVDALGNRDLAVNKAVELAELDDFRIKIIEEPVTPRELLMRELMGAVGADLPLAGSSLLQSLSEAGSLLNSLNDPQHVYALCEACQANGVNW